MKGPGRGTAIAKRVKFLRFEERSGSGAGSVATRVIRKELPARCFRLAGEMNGAFARFGFGLSHEK